MGIERSDVCYALHDFTAENPDELSFGAGELIKILEWDDQYGDGWYQGRNEAGDIGLFPQSYTSPTPPSPAPSDSASDDNKDEDGLATPNPGRRNSATFPTSETPEPQLAQKASAANVALGQVHLNPVDGHKDDDEVRDDFVDGHKDEDEVRDDSMSIRSGGEDDTTGEYHDGEYHDSPVLNPRAALAKKAAENKEREEREERERDEKRRKDDEEAYLALKDRDGLVEGLVVSDDSESEDESEDIGFSNGVKEALLGVGALAAGGVAAVGAAAVAATNGLGKGAAASDENEAEVLATAPTEVTADTTANTTADTTADTTTDSTAITGRPRADTVASKYDAESNYAESTYSTNTAGSPAPPVPALPVDTENLSPIPQPPGSFDTPVASASTSPALPPPTSPVLDAPAPETASALQPDTRSQSPLPTATAFTTPRETSPNLSTTPIVPPVDTFPSTSVAPVTLAPSPTITPASPMESPPAPKTPTFAPAPPAATAAVPLTPESATSSNAPSQAPVSLGAIGRTPSRSSSHLGSGGAMSTRTLDTSSLPFDPRVWSVEEVVEWGKGKGFDQLTLQKFAEHEISGDVLLEMDVAMLKEIDLVAFGRRVHIYNAIKELRHRLAPFLPSPLNGSLSGYDPDTPSTMGFASPMAGVGYGQFSPRAASERSGSAMGQAVGAASMMGYNGGVVRRSSRETADGLGFDDSYSTTGGRSMRGAEPLRQVISPSAGAQHTRSSTADSLAIGSGVPTADKPIPEEDEVAIKTTPRAPDVVQEKSKPLIPTSAPAVRRTAPTPQRKMSSGGAQSSGSDTSPKLRKAASEKGFFGSALGRNRKPPPKVPSSPEMPKAVPRPVRNKLAASTASRRSTFFNPFSSGGPSGSEKEKERAGSSESKRHTITTNLSSSAPSSMSAKAVDAAPAAMLAPQVERVTNGNLLDKIGTPDHSGWMRKKGEKYGWKQRFFVLKGVHLYYLKSESEQKAKGFINLTGYRVSANPDIHPGEFAFKIVHDTNPTHSFSAAEQVTIRTWMKEIMKATIGRDYSAAVVSSCDIETIPLKVAQTMNPRPRPPSPESRAKVQKERYAGSNPNTLSPKDAMILMEFSTSPLMPPTANAPVVSTSNGAEDRRPSIASKSSSYLGSTSASVTKSSNMVEGLFGKEKLSASTDASALPERLIEWVNDHLPSGTKPAADLNMSLRSGEIITRLVEQRSGTQSGIADSDFAKFRVPEPGQLFAAEYFDVVFSVFDFITPLVSTEDISMDDMLTGNENRMILLIQRIRTAFP